MRAPASGETPIRASPSLVQSRGPGIVVNTFSSLPSAHSKDMIQKQIIYACQEKLGSCQLKTCNTSTNRACVGLPWEGCAHLELPAA